MSAFLIYCYGELPAVLISLSTSSCLLQLQLDNGAGGEEQAHSFANYERISAAFPTSLSRLSRGHPAPSKANKTGNSPYCRGFDSTFWVPPNPRIL